MSHFDIEVFDCEQGTDEWFAARCGVVTASTFSDVLAKGKGITRSKLLYATVAEILTGEVSSRWSGNQYTERGKAWEAEVRSLYEATCEEEVRQVGFIRRGRIGCSPDSMVGAEGLLEIKTREPHLQVEVLEKGVLPSENVAQVQGQLLVTGRLWCDYVSYCRGLPQLKLRVYRDIAYLSNLKYELDQFLADLESAVARYGAERRAA